MNKRITALLLVLLTLAGLCGCASWDETAYDSDPLGELQQYYKPQEETVPALTAFVLPYRSSETADPIICSDGIQLTLTALLYEPLYRLTPDFKTEAVLAQSESYDPVSFSYTIELRSGLHFSDGSAVTAQDVAATLLRAQQSPRYAARLADVADIRAIDSTTVQLQLTQDRQNFTALLDIPVVKAGTESNAFPTGSGPYVKSADSDALLPNNYYRKGTRTLPFQKIDLLACKSEEVAAYAFSSHDVHLLACDLTGTAGDVASTCGSSIDADTTILQFLGFNMNRKLFQDSAMRLAISMAVDRNAIVSAYLMGHGTATQFPIHPASGLYPASLERSDTADDCAAAMAALNMANGEDVYDLTLLVNRENSFKVAAAEGIAQLLSQYDLNVTVNALPWEEYLAALEDGRFDLYYGECKLTADWDVSSLLSTGGSLNYGGWADPTTDTQLAACRSADDSHRAATLETLCGRLQAQMPIVPICFKRTSVLLPYNAVEGVVPTAADPFFGLENWTVHWADEKTPES